ncbi:hypothetical protein ACOSQ2_031268 [Xanthoceras sorbifolium]
MSVGFSLSSPCLSYPMENQNFLSGVEVLSNEIEELVSTLPREELWDGLYSYQYQGFSVPSTVFHSMIFFQRHFQARDTDVILVSIPKSGSTLSYGNISRRIPSIHQNPYERDHM